MKNRKVKIGICFSLISILTVGAACVISSEPSVEYFGNEEVNTSNDHKVTISVKENPLGAISYPYYFPIKLEEGWPISLRGHQVSDAGDPSKYIFMFDYPITEQSFGNMRDADRRYTNVNKIDGITSITVDYDYDKDEGRRSEVRLKTWFEGDEKDDLRANVEILKPGVPATFANTHPCYFSLDTIEAADYLAGVTYVKSITITYTCEKTVSPYDPLNTFEFDFDKVNKTATLTGVVNPDNFYGALTIPSHVADLGDPNTLYTITKIGNAVFTRPECKDRISNVTLPDTITEIGDFAFAKSSITNINMPDGLKIIGHNAFENTNLQSIDLHNVTTIGERAFYGCTTLISDLDLSNVTGLGNYVFARTGVKQVTYSNYLTTVPTGTFKSSSLRNITLDDRVTSIGDNAFNGANLHDLVLPSKLVSIGAGAFGFNDNLFNVTLPASVTTVSSLAFTNEMYNVNVHVSFAEGNTPAGFAADWVGDKATIVYVA